VDTSVFMRIETCHDYLPHTPQFQLPWE